MRPGIVDLRDLGSRYAWDPLKISRFVEAAGLAVGVETTRSFEPPRVVVLISPYEHAHLVQRARPWLAGTRHVVIIRDATEDGILEPELAAIVEEDWRDVLPGLSAEVIDWSSDDSVCRDAVARAIERCAALGTAQPAAIAPVPAIRELAPGPWSEYVADHDCGLVSFTAQLVVHGETLMLQTDAAGTLVELAALPPSFALRYARDAVVPAGTQLIPASERSQRIVRPGRIPLGFDAIHPVGWRGDRMSFYWSYVGRGDIGFLSASDHDYPCGPSKKLYGYEDNDPIQIVLAPTADACVARFEHDVMVTTSVPIPWTRAGAVDVAVFPRDPRRAVFFAQDPDNPGPHEPDLDPLEEDARDFAPNLVLGPDATTRYAIDLRFRVYRITRPPADVTDAGDGEVTHVGGPHEGYVVCDADHHVVRRGAGRLLGGWFRWATIEDAGAYWREDLVTGERTRLCPVDFAICDDAEAEAIARDAICESRYDDATRIRASYPSRAVATSDDVDVLAIPGTRNVLLVTARHVRVV